jgi:hypothetical protein
LLSQPLASRYGTLYLRRGSLRGLRYLVDVRDPSKFHKAHLGKKKPREFIRQSRGGSPPRACAAALLRRQSRGGLIPAGEPPLPSAGTPLSPVASPSAEMRSLLLAIAAAGAERSGDGCGRTSRIHSDERVEPVVADVREGHRLRRWGAV